MRSCRAVSWLAHVACVVLLVCAACGPKVPVDSGRDKGLGPAMSTQDALSQGLAPQRYAVLVGVDAYNDPLFPDLKHAVHDAEAVAEVLRAPEYGAFDEVRIFTTAALTKRESLLDELLKLKRDVRRQDTVVIYFSGHGTRVRDGDRWRRFLLTSDSKSRDLERTALDLEALQNWFGHLQPARKALVLDACFSGDGKSVVRSAPSADVGATPFVGGLGGFGPGEAHLFATSPGRPSREDDTLGHGVYTYYLLEAMSWAFQDADLDGDNVVTAYEAHDYARRRVYEFTGGVQVPEAAFRVVGEADVVLAGDLAERTRRDQALVYLYPSSGEHWDRAELVIDGRDRGVLPGTFAVSSGRHHLLLRDKGGDVLSSGHANLEAGRSYALNDLGAIAAGPTGAVAARAASLSSPPLRNSIGSGALGFEATVLRRVDEAPGRGLFGEFSIGLAGSPMRTQGSRAVSDFRPLVWTQMGVGVQHDFQVFRARAAWGISAVVIPADFFDGPPEEDVDPQDVPSQAGWALFATGPNVGGGVVLSDRISVIANARIHGAWLDTTGTGRARLVPWVSLSAGPEFNW